MGAMGMLTNLFSILSALYFLNAPITKSDLPVVCKLQKDADMSYAQIIKKPCFNEKKSFANIKWHTLHIALSGASNEVLRDKGEYLELLMNDYFTKTQSKAINNTFLITLQIDSLAMEEEKYSMQEEYFYKQQNILLAKILASFPLKLEVVLTKE